MSIFLLSKYDSTAAAPIWREEGQVGCPSTARASVELLPLKPQSGPASSPSNDMPACTPAAALVRVRHTTPTPSLHQIKKKTSGRYLLAPRRPANTRLLPQLFGTESTPPKGEVISYRERIGAQIYDICPHVTVCLGYAVASDTVAHER